MSEADRQRWDAKYSGRALPDETAPDDWLVECVADLRSGRALDLACGLGHNAIWLARRGWQVDAVDVSPVGLDLARRLAERSGTTGIRWIAADIDVFTPDPSGYDLVVVFRFLDRRTVPPLIESALKPGGRLVYETFTTAQLERPDDHLKNPDYVLRSGELEELFPKCRTVSYVEREFEDRCVAQYFGVRDSHDRT